MKMINSIQSNGTLEYDKTTKRPLQRKMQHSAGYSGVSVGPRVVTDSAPLTIVLDLHTTLPTVWTSCKANLYRWDVVCKRIE